jgi:CBS domain containing-hemolysin-like protein
MRDTLLLPTTQLARESPDRLRLAAQTPVYEALARIRKASVQLAVVMDGDTIRGIVTLADILKHILPAGIAAVQTSVVNRAA